KLDVSGSDVTLTTSYKFPPGFTTAARVGTLRFVAERRFQQVGKGLNEFAFAHKNIFPVHGIGPNGALLKKKDEKPLLSWRVAILPYIGEEELYKQFRLDEPWDSENNKKLIVKMPKVFAPIVKPGEVGYTHMQMVVSPHALDLPTIALEHIADGTYFTIGIV